MNWPRLFARKKYYPNAQVSANFSQISNCNKINFRRGKWSLISRSSHNSDWSCIASFLAGLSAVVTPDGLSVAVSDVNSLVSKHTWATPCFHSAKKKQVTSGLETRVHNTIRSRAHPHHLCPTRGFPAHPSYRFGTHLGKTSRLLII